MLSDLNSFSIWSVHRLIRGLLLDLTQIYLANSFVVFCVYLGDTVQQDSSTDAELFSSKSRVSSFYGRLKTFERFISLMVFYNL